MDDIIKFLMNYCMNHHIGVVYTKELPSNVPSKSYVYPSNLIVINGNWKPDSELPFMIAHEIGHIIEDVPEFYHLAYLGVQRGESAANKFAINLLEKYCFENDIWFETIYEFAKAFGVPSRCYYLLENKNYELG